MSERIQLHENLEVSRIVAGMMNLTTWSISDAQLLKFIDELLAIGVKTIDHADIYGSYTCEEAFGKAIKGQSALRLKLELVTKCGIALLSNNRPNHHIKHYDTSKAHIVSSADRSLTNLQTDFIDLLLIHRPDPLMDYEGIAQAFDTLQQQGKVKHFGVSNFTPEQIRSLQHFCDQPIVTNQIQLSTSHISSFHNGDLDFLQAQNIKPMAWSPLGGGQIFGDGGDEKVQKLRRVGNVLAEKYNIGLDQIMLAWLMMHPAKIIPVLGTGKIERIKAAVAAENLKLTRQEWFELYAATLGRSVA